MAYVYLTLFVIAVLAVFLAVRWVIKSPMNFGNLGRIASALLLAGGALLDQLNVLPWGTILSDSQAKLVGFAIALGMALLHVWDMAKGQLGAPTPPAPPVA